ncbi:hypothetical protein Q9L58_007553 [Maublancomyces gigas]|uniref:Uncharacterized protein n=1 Tax=Discina gigas TaxID=1032678 RepID=A0ABR3GD75_9PEZI
MASRLPRCLTATHGMFASGIRSTGIVGLLQQRTFSSRPAPPPAAGVRSSQPGKPGKPGKPEVSKHIGFYKEFGRPMSKVFLMAFFSYQVFYWLWVKMRKDEEKREKDKEVSELFAEVESLRRGAK